MFIAITDVTMVIQCLWFLLEVITPRQMLLGYHEYKHCEVNVTQPLYR
jgi:hypothetical protein